jgi:hypothetical protein
MADPSEVAMGNLRMVLGGSGWEEEVGGNLHLLVAGAARTE